MSAIAPAERWPSSSRPICRAGFQVDCRITSSSDSPSARNLLIVVTWSCIPAFIDPMCRSVEIESAGNPASRQFAATLHLKLPPPCPTSKITPRSRPAKSPGLGVPSSSSSRRLPEKQCV